MVRHFAECYSVGVVCSFSHDQTEVMRLGKAGHSGEVPIASHNSRVMCGYQGLFLLMMALTLWLREGLSVSPL